IAAAKAATPPTPTAVTPSPVQNSVRVAVFQAAPEGWVPSANGAIISQIPARVASAATTAPVNLRITAAFLLSRGPSRAAAPPAPRARARWDGARPAPRPWHVPSRYGRPAAPSWPLR